MSYTKDLLQINKKTSLVVLGCAILMLSAWYIPVKWMENEPVSTFDWCFAAIFLLNGTVHIIRGLGVNEERLFGRAYITITDTGLRIKPKALVKEQAVDWNEVCSIYIGKTSVNFLQLDLTVKQIQLSMFDTATLQEVKAAIMAMEDKNDIPKKAEE